MYGQVPPSTLCLPCPKGTYMPNTGASGKASCITCGAGYHGRLGLVVCEACAAGLFSSHGTGDSCSKCDKVTCP